MLIVMVFVLACGLFIDTLPAVIILVPVLAPLSDQFGIHPLHFAMAIVLNLTVGLITPPVGLNVFIISALSEGTPIRETFRGVTPFLVAEAIRIALLLSLPALCLTLPHLLRN